MGYSVNPRSDNTSTASGRAGDIAGGGTAFNIGGINLGTQYPTAATAGGSAPPSIGGLSTTDLLIGGACVLAIVLAVLWRK